MLIPEVLTFFLGFVMANQRPEKKPSLLMPQKNGICCLCPTSNLVKLDDLFPSQSTSMHHVYYVSMTKKTGTECEKCRWETWAGAFLECLSQRDTDIWKATFFLVPQFRMTQKKQVRAEENFIIRRLWKKTSWHREIDPWHCVLTRKQVAVGCWRPGMCQYHCVGRESWVHARERATGLVAMASLCIAAYCICWKT